MGLPKIEVATGGITGTTIKINGIKVDGVRSFKIEQNAGALPTLKMELIATSLTLDGVMLPVLPDIFKEFYERKELEELNIDNV
jgi:hypothetical protein